MLQEARAVGGGVCRPLHLLASIDDVGRVLRLLLLAFEQLVLRADDDEAVGSIARERVRSIQERGGLGERECAFERSRLFFSLGSSIERRKK